jgi:uncharacterized protein (DUF2141 family)
MKKIFLYVSAILLVSFGAAYASSTPLVITWQGRITQQGQLVNGTKAMRFAIVNNGGTNLWESASAGNNVNVTVNNSVYTVKLGDTSLSNMTALTAAVFDQGEDLYLRMWVEGLQLSPDVLYSSVPYALISKQTETITDNAAAGNSIISAIARGTNDIEINSTVNISGNLTVRGGVFRYAYFKDVKSAGADGGTFTSGAWQTRVLNTADTNIPGASLSSNQFTLPAGTYLINASAPGYTVDRHILKLRNITDSTDTLIGSAEHAYDAATYQNSNRSFVTGRFTITAPKTFALQHRCATTHAGNGLGEGTDLGVSNIYAQAEIIQIASE